MTSREKISISELNVCHVQHYSSQFTLKIHLFYYFRIRVTTVTEIVNIHNCYDCWFDAKLHPSTQKNNPAKLDKIDHQNNKKRLREYTLTIKINNYNNNTLRCISQHLGCICWSYRDLLGTSKFQRTIFLVTTTRNQFQLEVSPNPIRTKSD